MTCEPKPFKLPDSWPSKGSRIVNLIGQGWALHHPDREPMLYVDGVWKLLDQQRGVA